MNDAESGVDFEGWVTATELSRQWGCTDRYVRTLCKQGDLQTARTAEGHWLISRNSAAEFRNGRSGPSPTDQPPTGTWGPRSSDTAQQFSGLPLEIEMHLVGLKSEVDRLRLDLELSKRMQVALEKQVALLENARQRAEADADRYRNALNVITADEGGRLR
jgi:hypothetical protein